MGYEREDPRDYCTRCDSTEERLNLCRTCADRDRSDALTAARAAGYAECQADVVAWLLWKVSTLNSHTYGQDDERKVLERVMDGIEDACHVGAAKKGGK